MQLYWQLHLVYYFLQQKELLAAWPLDPSTRWIASSADPAEYPIRDCTRNFLRILVVRLVVLPSSGLGHEQGLLESTGDDILTLINQSGELLLERLHQF